MTSRKILELCQPVEFIGQSLLVYEITNRLEGNELVHSYRLRSKNGFRSVSPQNEKIIGTSITGRIVDVRRDEVQVHIDSDDDCLDGIEKWFQYSTVYSSPEGTGWYCMPERNDKIRVYFPDAEKNNAYVISAVHLGTVTVPPKQGNAAPPPSQALVNAVFGALPAVADGVDAAALGGVPLLAAITLMGGLRSSIG